MRARLSRLSHRVRLVLTSIRFRLTLLFAAILAAVLLVFSVFIYVQQSRDLREASLARLENKFSRLQAMVQLPRDQDRAGRLSLPSLPDNAQPLLQDTDIMALTDPSGQVVQFSGTMSAQAIGAIAQSEISQGNLTNPQVFNVTTASQGSDGSHGQYFFLLAPITLDSNLVAFLVMGSPVDPEGELGRLLVTLLLGSLGTLMVALGGGYWLADRAMRPVKTITQTALSLGETDMSLRLNLDRQDELGQLADTFDGMLDRIEAAFDRQRRFTADASHELRTPLTIIELEAARASGPGRSAAEMAQALSVIQSEGDFMARLVDNLLTLSRMDSGQTVITTERLDLSDLSLEAIERLAPLASGRSVTLEAGPLPELMVRGDATFLSRMIANLVENAIKYSAQSTHPVVRVETGRCQDGTNPAVCLWVRDNGPGIPPEHLPHLFERFYQVDPSRSRSARDTDLEPTSSGAGLGLSIVEWIARAHGGSVRVESRLGQGTSFEVCLPEAES
jgi:signal transduction histidine kinase